MQLSIFHIGCYCHSLLFLPSKTFLLLSNVGIDKQWWRCPTCQNLLVKAAAMIGGLLQKLQGFSCPRHQKKKDRNSAYQPCSSSQTSVPGAELHEQRLMQVEGWGTTFGFLNIVGCVHFISTGCFLALNQFSMSFNKFKLWSFFSIENIWH